MSSAPPIRDMELQHEGSDVSSDNNNGKDRERRRNKRRALRTAPRKAARKRDTVCRFSQLSQPRTFGLDHFVAFHV